MFIEKFRIQNFRGISDLTLEFNKGINILIGENNSGKTTIIDALRICLEYKDNNKTIYVSKKDFNINSDYEEIRFSLFFKASDIDDDLIYELYNHDTKYYEIHFKYFIKIKNNQERIYNKAWGGPLEGNTIPDEIFYSLYNIYLDPLRDSNRYLYPGRNNLMAKFFSNVESSLDYDKEELIQDLNDVIAKHDIIKFINTSKEKYIDSHLKGITHEDFPIFDINLIPKDFNQFVENFYITLPLDGKHLELSQNGLGYNNLIYMSILLGNLKDLNDGDNIYSALCIEEPEAHLHPQLQKLFFNYLVNEIYDKESSFQIFLSSHSPILIANSNLDSIIVIEKIDGNVNAVNLSHVIVDEKEGKYFKKHFDVSKANMLFSKKVLLVEGHSEKLLLPFFAKVLNLPFERENIEIIETEGIKSIEHYVKLFYNESCHLKKKCAVLVDNDKETINDEIPDLLKNLCENYNYDNVHIFVSEKNFEFEIINSNKDNIELLRKLLDRTIVRNINCTENFLENLEACSNNHEELIYDYLNNCKNFKKTNFVMKIIDEWETFEEFHIPNVVINIFDYLKGII